jgi:hypothetical protein
MTNTDVLRAEDSVQRDSTPEDTARHADPQPAEEIRAAQAEAVVVTPGQTHIRLEFGFPEKEGPGIVDRIIRAFQQAKAKMRLPPAPTGGSFIENYTRWAME